MLFSLVDNLFLVLSSTGAQLYKRDNMWSALPCRLTGKAHVPMMLLLVENNLSLWIIFEATCTMFYLVVENLFLLFSAGSKLYKEDNVGSVLPDCGLA